MDVYVLLEQSLMKIVTFVLQGKTVRVLFRAKFEVACPVVRQLVTILVQTVLRIVCVDQVVCALGVQYLMHVNADVSM